MNAPAELPVDRQRFIGGSDAAAILGVSPWATPLDVYLQKTGQTERVFNADKEKLFKRGKRLEPVVIDMLVEDLGIKVTQRSLPEQPNRYKDPEHPFLAAEIDFEWEVTEDIAAEYDLPRELVGTIQNGEVKTVHPFASAKFGEAETDEIPIEYAAQGMHGMMVCGRRLTMFGVLVGADSLSLYFLHRDDETIAGIRVKEVGFWHDHVLAGVPPKPVNLPDVMSMFRRLPAIKVEATPEVAELVKGLNAHREAERIAKQAQDELKFKIGIFMLGAGGVELDGRGAVRPTALTRPGLHALVLAGEPILEVKQQEQQRLDGDRLKAEHPDIAETCTKTIKSIVFSTPRKKRK